MKVTEKDMKQRPTIRKDKITPASCIDQGNNKLYKPKTKKKSKWVRTIHRQMIRNGSTLLHGMIIIKRTPSGQLVYNAYEMKRTWAPDQCAYVDKPSYLGPAEQVAHGNTVIWEITSGRDTTDNNRGTFNSPDLNSLGF